jgi:hypothetical protein
MRGGEVEELKELKELRRNLEAEDQVERLKGER